MKTEHLIREKKKVSDTHTHTQRPKCKDRHTTMKMTICLTFSLWNKKVMINIHY